jgi:hypothetical protein
VQSSFSFLDFSGKTFSPVSASVVIAFVPLGYNLPFGTYIRLWFPNLLGRCVAWVLVFLGVAEPCFWLPLDFKARFDSIKGVTGGETQNAFTRL